jgi:hypothetical protein
VEALGKDRQRKIEVCSSGGVREEREIVSGCHLERVRARGGHAL